MEAIYINARRTASAEVVEGLEEAGALLADMAAATLLGPTGQIR